MPDDVEIFTLSTGLMLAVSPSHPGVMVHGGTQQELADRWSAAVAAIQSVKNEN